MCVPTLLLLNLRLCSTVLLQPGFRLCYCRCASECKDVCNGTYATEFMQSHLLQKWLSQVYTIYLKVL